MNDLPHPQIHSCLNIEFIPTHILLSNPPKMLNVILDHKKVAHFYYTVVQCVCSPIQL